MPTVLVTGSAGLIGSEAVSFFHQKGFRVIGVDNNMRQFFFGEDGSTTWNKNRLESSLKNYTHKDIDIRNYEEINALFKRVGRDISLIVHAAAQPSHDWAAKEPLTDFSVNASGTLNLLEAFRLHCPEATFIFTSTNKVYGDTPNRMSLIERETRWEPESSQPYFEYGVDETMSIDNTKHSIFGVSKVAADLMVQEYGRYFGLKTGIFRCGCLTGPCHSAAELHGFLAYLVKCAMVGRPYTIFGYKGKQVRDNIHSRDLLNAFWLFSQNPGVGAVYNIGGSRHSNCSVLEAIDIIQESIGRELNYKISEANRSGDHIWWISDVRKFQKDYPDWHYTYDIKTIINEIIDYSIEKR